MKLLYVVSTLGKSGPTNQLYNLLKYISNTNYNINIITLSEEPQNSLLNDFVELGVNVESLSLSRLGGVFLARSRLKRKISEMDPDVIHTQGIRADSLMASLNTRKVWIMTARNYPPEDYPSKFGRLRGTLMVRRHIATMKKCSNVVACSTSIQYQLEELGIDAVAINNGVREPDNKPGKGVDLSKFKKPIFVSAGSLIPRKNMGDLINSFTLVDDDNVGTLLILGDGPELESLRNVANQNVRFLGAVDNVFPYFYNSDYFVSTSLSEGLPNTVLEALLAGLPVALSAIPPHQEIATHGEGCVHLFNSQNSLLDFFSEPTSVFGPEAGSLARKVGLEVFTAASMSQKYQDLYHKVVASPQA